ncbi:alcohol dehydrogenase class-3-like isoform X2 [Protopterus annectens]|uniref:alcohol dehydrogenase class-3-like isoform X2 n=1 Tax=Protopterus annectens TaxID=7888 RepID=UPI001CFBBD91|nr:alcohol dehydrogenase class-3-like isoform X2 [Protopterus annectens]
MDTETAGKVIKCKAAVAWEAKKPLSIEIVEVAPPKAHEVRIKITATGVCGTDAYGLSGADPRFKYPIIFGHEGAGIVESVGEGVTVVKPGDKVIPLYVSQCHECENCLNPNTNICTKIRATQQQGLMPDMTSRFTCKGKQVFHFLGCSTFAEYTVCADISVAKIDDNAPLDKVCLIGCAIPTGYGAAINTAEVKPGSTCAVFGLGGVGLSAVMGCKAAGASQIFGIDINKEKFNKAKELGATACLHPQDYDKPISEVLIELTNGGVHNAIECTGNTDVMNSAVQCCRPGWGKAVIIGLAYPGKTLSVIPYKILLGCTITGSMFGGWKSADSVPKLVSDYMMRKLKVDEFISCTLPISKVNEAFDMMHKGNSVRTVLIF